jgi:hypothetical protein
MKQLERPAMYIQLGSSNVIKRAIVLLVLTAIFSGSASAACGWQWGFGKVEHVVGGGIISTYSSMTWFDGYYH